MYNCLEVLTTEIISFVTGISNIDSYLRILSFTILIDSIVSFFSEESWISNSSLFNEKPFSGALFPWGRDKINLNTQTRKDISFCCHSMYNFFKIKNKLFNIAAFGFINVANFKLYCSNHESFLPIWNFLPCFYWWHFFFIQVYMFWYDLCLI